MLNILKYLLKNSFQPSINLELQKLYFPIDRDDSIVVEFNNIDYLEDEVILTEITDELLIRIINSNIKEISYVSTEYLGYREDLIEYNIPESQCIKLYETLKIYRDFNIKFVRYFCIINNYKYDTFTGFGCPDEPNYGFIIYLNKEFWERKEVYDFILKKEIEKRDPPIFLWQSYKNYEKHFLDSGIINVLTTNTKTRRFGYYSILSKYFIQYQKSSEAIFNKKFEVFSAEYSNQLKSYKNDKGEIKITKTGNSAGHYINLAKELRFVNLLNRIYTPGKSFKVYLILKREHEENNNIFELSTLDRLFFLETILREDYLYISWLIELIFIKEKTSYSELNSLYQKYAIDRITELENKFRTKTNLKLRRKLAKIKERITKWEKPVVYLEHVLMPRINWLYDLEILELDNNLNIELSEYGRRLFYNICYLTDIITDRFINFEFFLDAFYIHIFNDIYFFADKNEQDIEFVNKKITEYILESFQYFKTLAPNRVTASQAILFTKYKLYLSNKIKVEYSYIKKHLENSTLQDFIFKYQSKYSDGYIQIK